MMSVVAGITFFILMLGLPAALILWIVRVVRHEQSQPITAEQVRHVLIGAGIAIVTPLFLVLLTNQLAPTYPANFTIALVLAALVLVAGISVRQILTIGTALMLGGIATLSYAFGVHGQEFDPGTKLVISLIGLILVVGTTYWSLGADERAQRTATIRGFRMFIVGALVTVLALLATSFAAQLAGPTPGDSDYVETMMIPEVAPATTTNAGLSFAVTLLAGALWITIGAVARRVSAISIGCLVAGALTVLSSLAYVATSLQGAGPVLATGVVLTGLLVLAYRSLRPKAGE